MDFSFTIFSSTVIIFCLLVFSFATLWSIARARSARKRKPVSEPGEHHFEEVVAGSVPLSLVMIGTLAFAVMILVYVFLTWISRLDLLEPFSLQAFVPFNYLFQFAGLLLLVFGFLFFAWSIVVRALALHSNRLVTCGPYRFVRHPSYFSYFLMFVGLFLLWTNILTFFPFVAIPGYLRVTSQEEVFLQKQFGKRYRQYQMRTGRLFPKIVHRRT